MFSPSDYDDAVPKFTNGSYANTPPNPLYVEEPDAANYNRGAEPLQTLPAQWWNWLCNKITSKLNNLNTFVKNIFDELAGLLSVVGETPDATSEEVTTGQLKGMFETKYPIWLGDNFKFESVLQGRTRGVMLPPSDTWDADTSTLSLSGGFGILDTCKNVNFADSTLVFPNDGAIHYIVSAADGTLSIESALDDNVILVGLCHDDEYCLLIDNNPDQCKDNIILKKWFGQNKITQDFVSVLQSYYNTSISSIETKIYINTVSSGYGIDGGTFNNCTINFTTVSGGYGVNTGIFNNCTINVNTVSSGIGIDSGTFNNCTINFTTVSGGFGVNTGIFNNCTINFNTVSGGYGTYGVTFNNCTINFTTVNKGYGTYGGGTFNNCTINFYTVSGGYGIDGGTFKNCTINFTTVSGGTSISNSSYIVLYLTYIKCSATTDLSNTGGKRNILNDANLH